MPALQRIASPTADAHVDEANPDTTFGTEDTLYVRSQTGANRRTWLTFDLADIVPDGWMMDTVDRATLRARPSATSAGRALEARLYFGTFDEATLTWNNQPALADTFLQDTHADTSTTPHAWDVTEAIALYEGEEPGLNTFLILDASEDAGQAHEQAYPSREHADGRAFELEVEFTLVGFFPVDQDTYVDEATPDTNHEGDTRVWIRSDQGANRRTLINVPLDLVPAEADALDRVQISDQPETSDTGRTLEARAPDADADLAGVTWNTQPNLGEVLATEDSGDTTHRWNSDNPGSEGLLNEIETRWQQGDATAQLVLLDSDEDASLLAFEQEYKALEAGVGGGMRIWFWISEFVRTGDLDSQVEVVYAKHLDSHVQPGNIPAVADLDSLVDVFLVEHLAATVAPRLVPLSVAGRVQGLITRLFLEPLEDFRRITDEAGSVVTRVQDGTTTELRRIVQVVASGTPAFSLSETPTFPGSDTGTPDTLRRGDAILFGLGSDRWDPGARVTVEGAAFVVAGVLGTERVEDQVLYQEIGLRRLSATTQGRAVGVVG